MNSKKLKEIVFIDSLGTYWNKKERVKKLLFEIKTLQGIEFASDRAIEIVTDYYKADLATHIVREFPKLQGIMGEHYLRLMFGTMIANSMNIPRENLI